MGILDLFRDKKPDESALLAEIDEVFDPQRDYSRQMLERIWFRNLLYYCGEQWLTFLTTTGTFARRIFPAYVPTPVSNEIRDYVRSQKALLLNQKLVPKIWPNTSEKADALAAKLGEEVLVYLDSLDDGRLADEKEKAAIWTIITGTGFVRTYPYKEGGEWFATKGGVISTGEVKSECVIPFNVRVDPLETVLEDMRYVGVQSLKRKDWIEDTFGVKLTKSDDSQIIDYQKRLAKLVGQVSPWKGIGLESSALTDFEGDDLYLFKELEFKPTKKHPEGKYVASAGGKLLRNIDRLPIKAEKGKFHYTLTDFHFDYVPGRFWSDGGVNDLISPQNSINQIDQALEVNRKGLARPRVVTPSDVSLKRVNEGGQGLLVLTYDPLLSGGNEPKIENGTPFPAQVLEERRNHKEQIQSSAGDPKNILKGMPPSASASGVQVDILRETALAGHAPDVERFNRSWGRVAKKRLLVVQELYTEERTIKVAGKGNKVSVKQFKASDLRNNTDVRLELDSGLSTTNAGKTSLLMDMAGNGFLGPVAENPEIRQEFLRKNGLAGFAEFENADSARAEEENAQISAGDFSNIFLAEAGPDGMLTDMVLNEDPAFKFDRHEIHAEIHRRFILSSEFRDLDPKMQEVLMMHTTVHKVLADAQMQAQMMAQGGPGNAVPASEGQGGIQGSIPGEDVQPQAPDAAAGQGATAGDPGVEQGMI